MTKRWLVSVAAVGVVAVGAAGCGGPQLPRAAHGEVLVTVEGKVKYGPFPLGRADLEALPRAGFRAVDPVTGREARYDGVSLGLVLGEKIEGIEGADTVVIHTASKEALPLPPVVLRQYKPILADRIDGQPVPPQLAWPNLEQLGLQRDPRAVLWWARQVVRLELISWDRTWGRSLRPPPGASDAARLGGGQYALRCTPCHQLGKSGGARGPALDGAATRLGLTGFMAALKTHAAWQERVGTELSPGDQVAGQLHAFLAAVDTAGDSLQDEVTPERPATPSGPPAGPGAGAHP
jgi:hypothetical protein